MSWQQTALGLLADLKNGVNFTRDNFGEGIKVLGVGDFKDHTVPRVSDLGEIEPEGVVREKDLLKAGDIVFVRSNGNRELIGRTVYIDALPEPVTHSGFTIRARFHSETAHPRFFAYLFRTRLIRQVLSSQGGGANINNLNQQILKSLQVPLPPLEAQVRIASILSAYDDLIENNLRRIQILEEMAQALYREWFVDFRFPGRSDDASEDSVSRQSPPENWEVMPLSDVCDVLRGRSYGSKNLVEEGGLPFVNLKCVDRDGGFRVSGLKRYDGPLKESQMVRPGDIVMAVTDMTQERRIVARAARVPDFGEAPAAFSMDLVRIAPAQNVAPLYLYAALRWSSFPDEVKQHASGVNVLHLSPDLIRKYEMLVPPAGLRDGYGRVVTPMVRLQDGLAKANSLLRRTRDLLLPRLISGELDVSALDIEVVEAA